AQVHRQLDRVAGGGCDRDVHLPVQGDRVLRGAVCDLSGDGGDGMARLAPQHDRQPAVTSGRVVCVTGPESTGKTTLATELAAALAAPLVAEVSRRYLAGRSGYGPEDVLAIAREQQAAEQRALAAG